MKIEETRIPNAEETEQEPIESEIETAPADPATPEVEEDEVQVTIGEPTPDADPVDAAPPWVRELRKTNREQAKKIKELEARSQPVIPQPSKLGAKPTLEAFDYDSEKYEAELSDWFDRKRKVEQEEEAAKKTKQAEEQAWQEKLATYQTLKDAIKVKDFDEAEQDVQAILNVTQQGIILQGAENPALVIYALGKNQAKAKELAAISDPVKYAFAIAKLEDQLKVTKKAIPQPEKVVNGTGRTSGSVDSQLEALRSDAERTGNYTKVNEYNRNKRRSQS